MMVNLNYCDCSWRQAFSDLKMHILIIPSTDNAHANKKLVVRRRTLPLQNVSVSIGHGDIHEAQ